MSPKALLDVPTAGWKADLPLPWAPPDQIIYPIGVAPNYADDIYLELHTAKILNRTVVCACGIFILTIAILMLIQVPLELADGAYAFKSNPLAYVLVLGATIAGFVLGIGMLRTGVATPRDEPIRFNRERGRVYLYRFHSGGPISRKGWGVRPEAFDWKDLRAEAWSRMAPSPSGVPIFAWGVDIAVVAPDTNRVIDRFQLAGSNANGEHMWAMARAFMNQGPEALPQYPNPPRDWNNDVPSYHLALRLAPKVQWPEDMDRESRTAPGPVQSQNG